MLKIDWLSNESHVFLNPRLPAEDANEAKKRLPKDAEFEAHIWLATSGSTAKNSTEVKYAALSKKAMLSSAAAVNEHLESGSEDVWINPLPLFHVGGLGILARSWLSGAKVWYLEKWSAQSFRDLISHAKGTLSALVPAQVYDLVTAKLRAPPSLRAIVVGGGHLNEQLHCKAAYLGWVLLPSYGMTEACSQIATVPLQSSKQYPCSHLKILPHFQMQINAQGLICLKGPSLLTIYGFLSEKGCELFDPKRDGWFTTADCGESSAGHLKLLGRTADFIKIGGESVDMTRLDRILDEIRLEIGCNQDAALVPVPDERLGHVVHIAVEGNKTAETKRLIEAYQERAMPFEKVRQVHAIDAIPRSPLKKLLREQLVKKLLFQ